MAMDNPDEEIEGMGIEEYRKIFTEFQKFDKILGRWASLSKNTKDK